MANSKIHKDMYTDKTIILYNGTRLNYLQIGQALDGVISLIKRGKKEFKPGVVYSTTFSCREGKYRTKDERNGKDRFRNFNITIACDKNSINFVIDDGKILPYKDEDKVG